MCVEVQWRPTACDFVTTNLPYRKRVVYLGLHGYERSNGNILSSCLITLVAIFDTDVLDPGACTDSSEETSIFGGTNRKLISTSRISHFTFH